VPRAILNWLLFLLPPAVSVLFIINLCGLIYSCGCQSWWSGAAAHCNIHNLAGRHCPWCSHGTVGFNTVLGSVLVPQVVLSFYPIRVDWRLRLLGAFLVFPLIGLLEALALGWSDGYWSR
jgi:hypothetical protein